MHLKGKRKEALPVVTVQVERGHGVYEVFVLEYWPGQDVKPIAFYVFGDEMLQHVRISVGEELICDIDFKAVKGKNGYTFNSVDCWNVTRVNQVQQQTQQQQAPMQQPQQAAAAPQGCQVVYPDRQPAQAPRQPQQTQTPFPPQDVPQDDGQLPF